MIGPLHGSLGPLTIPRNRQAYIDWLLALMPGVALWDTTIAAGQTIVPDLGPGHYNGTASGGVTFGVPGIAGQTAAGLPGTASTGITLPSSAALLPAAGEARAYGVWVKFASLTPAPRIWQANNGTNAIEQWFFAGSMTANIKAGGVNYSRNFLGDFSSSVGAWMLLVITFDGTSIKVFRNGAELSVAAGTDFWVGSGVAFTIGGTADYPLNGSLALPFIYPGTLDAATINEIYTRGLL
jgi:hypothetical protein